MSVFKRVLLALSFLFVTINANAQLSALDGNWYSKQWKYGYVLKNGIGTATSTNSPNFQVGQNIIQLTATSNTTFTGRQVYTDGKFYKINARLESDGRLYFEGEKNAKWVIERVGAPPVANVPPQAPVPTNQQPNNPQPNIQQTSIAQKLQMAGDAIGGPPGWGTCMAAHITLDIAAGQPGALLPRLAEANQALGILLGEIRQMYLRRGIPDATLGQHLKANTGRFRTGDEALDMVVKCNNKISEVVG